MTDAPRIVILGGHGKVAQLLAPKLVEGGFAVDSLIRDPDQKADIEKTGASPVVLDIEHADEAALADAFRGAEAVVFSAGAGGGDADRTDAVDRQAAIRSMNAAKAAGVARYVMVSYATAAQDASRLDPSDDFHPYASAKNDADEHLRSSGLDWTILGPGMLTLEDSTGTVALADETGEVLPEWSSDLEKQTSRELVADVIAHVIREHAAAGKKINVYDGPTPIAEAIV